MAQYNPASFENKWQKEWAEKNIHAADNHSEKEKFYVLDMFPYPSGAGLHVGHPLGYIASDIYARYKRLKGFNVLHPMGYDAFGLPAEQYAIQTGQHPAITTAKNIERYREQLDKIGFSYDWNREVQTCDPDYYKWTQWIFIQLFESWYNPVNKKAEPIATLVAIFENQGFTGNQDEALTGGFEINLTPFSADEWKRLSPTQKEEVLLNFRLAYLSETYVNWCAALGCVLANEEVKDGLSERGGFPVERKRMKQWSLRITAYAERLLEGLDRIDWSPAIKETQRNWIGKSEGCSLFFAIEGRDEKIEVFTTRPDTIFGVTFLTLAPEHQLVAEITPADRRSIVNEYVNKAKNRTERERMADVKQISGEFTGAYALHPFSGERIPIWVGDYVLAGYGTGAVMAVPGHDSRDHAFALHFNLPIIQVVEGKESVDIQAESYDAKDGILIQSDFLNGLNVKDAIKTAIKQIESKGLGQGKINYRLRDAVFGRQRYWGEPIPIRYVNGLPQALKTEELPLLLPEIDAFLPTPDGEPPLARKAGWEFETTTMPGWAGSSWYFLRYMDPKNTHDLAAKEALDYWQNVDLYIGGSEHATGHLLYARFWMKFLYDIGLVQVDEPFKKLLNQGMIQGRSSLITVCDLEFLVPISIDDIIDETEREEVKLLSESNSDILAYRFFKLVLSKGIAEKYKNKAITIQTILEECGVHNKYNIPRILLNNVVAHPSTKRVPIQFVENDRLDIEKLKADQKEYASDNYFFVEEISSKTGLKEFVCDSEVEKMSKSKWNVVNPDDIIEKYGADTLRLYEMFLGPVEMAKPWNTNGIEGVYRFLSKLWRLFMNDEETLLVIDAEPTAEEWKVLHKTIKKVGEDIESFSFNTSVSTFMIAVNELSSLDCHKRKILEPLLIILSPFAPHIAEELWSRLGNSFSVTKQTFPTFDPALLTENTFQCPISINGKTRTQIEMPVDISSEAALQLILENETAQKWMEGKEIRKFIFVPGRIANVVV